MHLLPYQRRNRIHSAERSLPTFVNEAGPASRRKPIRLAASVADRYDGLKKENSLLSTKLGNLIAIGEIEDLLLFPSEESNHGR